MDYAAVATRLFSSLVLVFFKSRSCSNMKYKPKYYLLPILLLCYLCIPLYLPLTSSSFAANGRPIRHGGWLWAGFNSACVLSLLLLPGLARHSIGLLLLLYIHKEYSKSTTGQAVEDYMIAINIFITTLKFVDFVYLRIPEDAAHRVNASGQSTEDGNSIRNSSYWTRLKWAASLYSTLRGIGWNWRVKNVESIPPDTRRWSHGTHHWVTPWTNGDLGRSSSGKQSGLSIVTWLLTSLPTSSKCSQG